MNSLESARKFPGQFSINVRIEPEVPAKIFGSFRKPSGMFWKVPSKFDKSFKKVSGNFSDLGRFM